MGDAALSLVNLSGGFFPHANQAMEPTSAEGVCSKENPDAGVITLATRVMTGSVVPVPGM